MMMIIAVGESRRMTRAEAIELLVNATYSEEWQGNEQLTKAQHMAIEALEREPIIRCKDCKHWGGVVFGNKCTMLSGLDYVIGTKENDFCSFGERKESEE